MKEKATSAALLIALGGAAIVAAQCTNPVVRREWNQLSSAEKTQYVGAAKAAATSLTGSVAPGTMSLYDFVASHTQVAGVSHGNAQFYPFHRAMIYLWETTLAVNGWNGGAVYWDWSAVSQNWWEADVFQYMGTTSRPEDNCVVDGLFGLGQYQVSPNPAFGSFARDYQSGDRSCLRRCGSPGVALDNPEAIAQSHLVATDYNAFRGNDISGYHANGHIIIGGACDMGNFFSSPNDPLFFLHHTFIDKTWWKWQMLCPEYIDDYEGAMIVSPASPSGVASLDQVLDGWGGYTVRQMLDTQNGDPLCYTYSKSLGDVTNFNAPSCPSGTPANKNWPFAQALKRGNSGGGNNGGNNGNDNGGNNGSGNNGNNGGNNGNGNGGNNGNNGRGNGSNGANSASPSASASSPDGTVTDGSINASFGSGSASDSVSASDTESFTATASANGVVSIPTSRPNVQRNLLAESTWLADVLQSLVAVHTDNGTKSFSSRLRIQRRDDDITYLNTNFKRRSDSTEKDAILFDNLSDDGWQSYVKFNSQTNTVCYKVEKNCVQIPQGFSVLAIYKDFVSTKSDDFILGSPIDPNNPMPIRKLYPPSKLTCESYTPTGVCTGNDSLDCLAIPPMPSDEILELRMINKKIHQCYMNKVWKWIDDCNVNQNCTSVATTSLKNFIEHGDWSNFNL